jgi:hypothetical protein
MTPETEQVPTGYARRPRRSPGVVTPPRLPARDVRSPGPEADGGVRSGQPVFPADQVRAARTGRRGAAARPSRTTRPEPAAPAAGVRPDRRPDRSIVGAVPYLAVLLCVLAGVYVAWNQGSAGGGKGGAVSGIALLAAAALRLLLPARLVGLLGTRKRVTDVLTLAVLGGGLLVASLVLPH